MRYLLVLSIVAGGAMAALVAARLAPAPPKAPASQARQAVPRASGDAIGPTVALRAARGSHFVDRFKSGVVETDSFRCTIMTPNAVETPEPPTNVLTVIPGDGTYRTAQAWFDAVGPLSVPPAGKDALLRKTIRRLETSWKTLVALANGPAATPPLRVLVKHYPRPDLPGRCFVVHATAYNVADPYLDRRRRYSQDVRGLIFDVRKTYQLAGKEPRLVEAQIEVHTGLVRGLGKRPFAYAYTKEDLPKDDSWSAHFEHFVGGLRSGLIWLDKAAGMGEPDVFRCAYSITSDDLGSDLHVETTPIGPAQTTALLEFVSRS